MTSTSFGRRGQQNLNQNSMVCTVCQKQKHQLKSKKSKLMPNLQMYVCASCFENKYEPRWLIILVGQSEGVESIQNYIVNRRYVGNEISALDLIK